MCFCSNGHEEIGYDDHLYCPMCNQNDKIKRLEIEIKKLETILKTKYKIS